MTDTQNLTLDEQIRDTLISHGVITSKRVKRCGQWSNPETYPPRPRRYFCGLDICRPCRQKRTERIQTDHFIQNKDLTDKGGDILLFTLTVPHSIRDSLSSIYTRFKKSLTDMKRGWTWKKLKRDTGYEHHYDTFELTKTDKGYHFHDHITWGCLNNKLSLESVKDELFKTWTHYTRRNGFKRISKSGIDVTLTPYGGHSGSKDTKSVNQLTESYGTREYWEYELYKCDTQPNYKHPEKTIEEIQFELFRLNFVSKGSRRGRVYKG